MLRLRKRGPPPWVFDGRSDRVPFELAAVRRRLWYNVVQNYLVESVFSHRQPGGQRSREDPIDSSNSTPEGADAGRKG